MESSSGENTHERRMSKAGQLGKTDEEKPDGWVVQEQPERVR